VIGDEPEEHHQRQGAVRDCCVEGRRRVTHRAESRVRLVYLPVCLTMKPVGEPDALIGHVPVR